MKTEVIHVTPKLASKWLRTNTHNRNIRRGVVDGIKAALCRGEYVMSHQGIAFTEDNVLADGQHRLTAISELESGSFPMLVTTGLSKEAFKVMDIGLKRSAADALGDDRRVVEVAMCFAKMCETRRKCAISPTMLIPYIDRVRNTHNDLMAYCPTTCRTWSSVPVRAAAVLAILRGADSDYVKMVYRSLVLTDLDMMPPVVKGLFKSQLSGLMNIRDIADTIARMMVAFDKKKANNGKIQIKDSQEAYRIVRETFFDLLP